MIHYTKERISETEFFNSIRNNVKLEVLVLGEYWYLIGEHVYSWDYEKLEECFKTNNYRVYDENNS
jgi:predicted membrane channel-forming protein YqfA (hemolysin III family)